MSEIDILYTGSRQSAEYVKYYLNQKNKEFEIRIIKITKIRNKTYQFPWKIARLMLLEFPSLIVIERTTQYPIINIEFCGRKPMGYNHSQFFARIYQSGRCKVPFLFIYPSRAFQVRKSEGGRNAIEYDSPIYLNGLLNANKIFKVPILAFNWNMDFEAGSSDVFHGSLVLDSKFIQMSDSKSPEMVLFINLLNRYLTEFFNGNFNYFEWEETKESLSNMESLKEKLSSRTKVNRSFRYEIFNPNEFLKFVKKQYNLSKSELPERFLQKSTIVHRNTSKTIRSDPYVGLYALYDLTFCRDSENIDEKYNLVGYWANEQLSKELAEQKFRRFYGQDWKSNLIISLEAWIKSNQKIGRCITYFLDGFLLNDGYFWKSLANHPLFMDDISWDLIKSEFPESLDIENIITQDELDEEDIAFSVRDILLTDNWKILSFNPPRGIRHIDILGENSGIVRAFKAKVPDIIAFKENALLILEFKVDLDQSDIKKLLDVKKSNLEVLQKEHKIPKDYILIKGIGISNFERRYYDEKVLPDEIVTFIVNKDTKKACIYNENDEYSQYLERLPKYEDDLI